MNRGQKICLRLRYPGDRSQFLPIESVIDTLLHELCHNVYGPHNQQFHALWDELRDEQQGLLMKGYTGEGFLSRGQKLGGKNRSAPQEARRLALQAAEQRRGLSIGSSGSGRRLGGIGPRPGDDIRKTIADAVERRSMTLRGCGTEKLDSAQIQEISDSATRNGFRTQAEEDEANEVAIAQALLELVHEDERAKRGGSASRPAIDDQGEEDGYAAQGRLLPALPTSNREAQDGSSTVWICAICTLQNPAAFLCCDACGSEHSNVGSAKQLSAGPARAVANTQRSSASSSGTKSTMIDLTGDD